MKILAFESSCDETSVSIVENGQIRSNIISSQYFHKKYGGVVPELASRAHLEAICELTTIAFEQAKLLPTDIEAIAVTTEPGLIGSLIVGSNFAKGLSVKYNLPIVPINHIEGHIYSGLISNSGCGFPFINLLVSGGHTAIFLVHSFNDYEIVGLTRDDAAGEAFDKIAKLLGLAYPGGPEIDKLAQLGNSKRFDFPRSMINSGDYDFSFSGLKTSVKNFVYKNYPGGVPSEVLPDIAASVQAAIVDVLVAKTIRAAEEHRARNIVISGGVSANSWLREKMKTKAAEIGISTYAPEMGYCMDNAAMIGFIAEKKLLEKGRESFFRLDFRVSANALRSRKKNE
ncbi:MAG: tRNA (adenosine(37)-N6)-threonylcarbamoyltransferase complex transferase subunit TsaD [Ignavibacteria bacterium]|nr:tRNA (adenosine(37)-N6)-threonylcarbamoyltransferase complex transferase subunit TsaD [Ignavibacteria bacterium]